MFRVPKSVVESEDSERLSQDMCAQVGSDSWPDPSAKSLRDQGDSIYNLADTSPQLGYNIGHQHNKHRGDNSKCVIAGPTALTKARSILLSRCPSAIDASSGIHFSTFAFRPYSLLPSQRRFNSTVRQWTRGRRSANLQLICGVVTDFNDQSSWRSTQHRDLRGQRLAWEFLGRA